MKPPLGRRYKMNIDAIREMAQENEVFEYFKKLYNHAIRTIEGLPCETIKEILSRPRNDADGEYGIVDGFLLQNAINEGPENDDRLTDKIWLAVDVLYTTTKREEVFLAVEECYTIESPFNYRCLSVKFSLRGKYVIFSNDLMPGEVLNEEDRILHNALRNEHFLERIFGKYLIENSVDPESNCFSFTVATKCFER